jgi:hypothetical protein
MTESERRAWKARTRPKFEPFIRREVTEAERLFGPMPDPTRPERIEDIRTGILAKARAYRALMEDPPDDEMFALQQELFNEIIDDIKRTTVS